MRRRDPDLQAMASWFANDARCAGVPGGVPLAGGRAGAALAGGTRDAVLDLSNVPVESARLQQIAAGGYRGAARERIRGNGYVVDSVEAALWCFDRHDTFETVVLEAANLGETPTPRPPSRGSWRAHSMVRAESPGGGCSWPCVPKSRRWPMRCTP